MPGSACSKTLLLLEHEQDGIPEDVWPLLDAVVDISMIGLGASLDVAVAAHPYSTDWTDWRYCSDSRLGLPSVRDGDGFELDDGS